MSYLWQAAGTLISVLYLSGGIIFMRRVMLKGPRRPAADMERGQGLVEYALILVLVAVVVIAILLVLGPSIKNIF